MVKPDFTSIERRFTEVMAQLARVLPAPDKEQVVEFIDAGEYGLALEWLANVIVEENKPLSRDAFEGLVDLAERMGVREQIVTEELHSRIR